MSSGAPTWSTPEAWATRPIVMVTTSWPNGPTHTAGRFVETLASRLVEEGHAVTVVTPAGPHASARPGTSRHRGVRVVRAGFPGWHGGPFHADGLPETMAQAQAGMWASVLAGLVALAGAACRESLAADRPVVAGHWLFPGGPIARAAAWVSGGDATIICHSSALRLAGQLPRALGTAVAALCVGASPVLVTCHELGQILRRMHAQPRATVMPMPVPPARRTGHPRAGPPWRLLAMGRLVPIKGLGSLIAAVSDIDDVELHIAGDGPQRHALEAMSEGRVRFHGTVVGNAKAELFSSVHGYVQASRTTDHGRSEGMPVSMLEALSYNLPVVATKVGGALDLEQHPDVILCDTEVEDIGAAIRQWRTQLSRSQHEDTPF